jgi:hypothetical protein
MNHLFNILIGSLEIIQVLISIISKDDFDLQICKSKYAKIKIIQLNFNLLLNMSNCGENPMDPGCTCLPSVGKGENSRVYDPNSGLYFCCDTLPYDLYNTTGVTPVQDAAIGNGSHPDIITYMSGLGNSVCKSWWGSKVGGASTAPTWAEISNFSSSVVPQTTQYPLVQQQYLISKYFPLPKVTSTSSTAYNVDCTGAIVSTTNFPGGVTMAPRLLTYQNPNHGNTYISTVVCAPVGASGNYAEVKGDTLASSQMSKIVAQVATLKGSSGTTTTQTLTDNLSVNYTVTGTNITFNSATFASPPTIMGVTFPSTYTFTTPPTVAVPSLPTKINVTLTPSVVSSKVQIVAAFTIGSTPIGTATSSGTTTLTTLPTGFPATITGSSGNITTAPVAGAGSTVIPTLTYTATNGGTSPNVTLTTFDSKTIFNSVDATPSGLINTTGYKGPATPTAAATGTAGSNVINTITGMSMLVKIILIVLALIILFLIIMLIIVISRRKSPKIVGVEQYQRLPSQSFDSRPPNMPMYPPATYASQPPQVGINITPQPYMR